MTESISFGQPSRRFFRTSASALMLSAVALAGLPASAQQGLPEAQPVEQRPAAEGQQQNSQLPQAQQRGRQEQKQSVDPRAKDGQKSMYETRVSDVRDTVVVDTAGASIGYVKEVVIKQDNSEAGLVISTGGEQEYVYVPLTEVRLEGEQFLLTSKVSPAPVSERELIDRNFNEISDSDRPLSDYIQPRQQKSTR